MDGKRKISPKEDFRNWIVDNWEALEDEIYEEVEKWLNANKEDLEEERARLKWERETPEHFKVCEPERL